MMIWAYENDNYTNDVNNNITNSKISKSMSIQLLEKYFMTIKKFINKYAFDVSNPCALVIINNHSDFGMIITPDGFFRVSNTPKLIDHLSGQFINSYSVFIHGT